MAIYTHNEVASSPTTTWIELTATITSISATTVVLTNSDGTLTILTGTGFAGTTGAGGSLTSGTISAAARTDAGNTITYETVTGASYAATAASSALAASGLQGVAAGILSGADILNGYSGDDFFKGFAGNDTFNGGGGLDTVRYSGPFHSGAIAVVLSSTSTVTSGPSDGVDTLNSVEQVIGSNSGAGDDFTATASFSGSFGTFNMFEGRGGNDRITGNGNTRISYNEAAAGVTVNLANGTATGDTSVGSDTFSGVNSVLGSQFADTLTGDSSANVLIGQDGNDTLDGGAGADELIGGRGDDTYVVDSTLDTITETIFGANLGGVDTVQTSLAYYVLDAGNLLENLTFTNASTFNIGIGNQIANVLTGTSGSDSLTGNGGNDTFNAGGGNDYLYVDRFDTSINAGAGYDVIYISDDAGFTLNVGAAQAEWVYGWVGNNVLNASTAAAGVTMVGEAGADQLIGSAFDDYLYIDSLDTVIDAGAGNNDALFVFVGSGQVATDTTINVATANAEWVLGGDGNDTIFNTGDSSNVTLSGGGGNDTITGGLANDYLYGNAGNDIFVVTANAQFDAVLDFQDGLDRINVHNLGAAFDTFAEIQAVASSNGSGSTIINFGGGNTLFLYNFNVANLTAGDFIF